MSRLGAHYEKNKEKYQSLPTVKVRYLQFSPGDFKGKTTVSQDQVEAYYLAHESDFSTPEKVEASHILLRVAEDADEETVKSTEEQAREVYEKAMAGEDFAELARKYSQDASKENGGHLGTFEKDDMVAPFGEKAFSMKVNEISEPVRTVFGWHIIKVNGRVKATTRSLEEARGDIQEKLETEALKNAAYTAASTAIDAVIDGDDLEQAGLITNEKVLEAGPFDATGPREMGADGAPFANVALSLPVGEISDVKEVGDSFYIIRVLEKAEPEILPLEAVKDKVATAVKIQLQDDKARETAQAWLDKAGADKDIKSLAISENMPLKSTALFTRQRRSIPELGQSPEIIAKAFELKGEGLYPGVLKGNDGYYLISLKEKKTPTEAEVKEHLADVKNQLKSMKQNAAYTEWIAALKSKSTIEIQPDILD